MLNIQNRIYEIVDELRTIAEVVSEEELEKAAEMILDARKVVFTAQGRSGNSARSLVCRMMHVGIDVHMAGQPDTPAIGEGDLLIAVSSSAGTKITLNHLETARKAGAKTLLITAKDNVRELADEILCIPAKTKVPSDQHAGSLFEQSVLVIGDAVCWYLMQKTGVSTELMNRRHANLQ